MYHIHHTRGLVLWSMPTGESNRFYKIFTEELGLVGVSAQSVREEKSKLRYVLQDFSWVTLDLVRGKEVWRITSAGEGRNLSIIKGDHACFKLFARMCLLVLRLVHGEGREDNLFHDLVSMTEFLEKDVTSHASPSALSIQRDRVAQVVLARPPAVFPRRTPCTPLKNRFPRLASVAREGLQKDSIDAKLELAFEAIVELRILAHLGYLDPVKYENFLYPAPLSTACLSEFEKIRTATIPVINNALHVSQL